MTTRRHFMAGAVFSLVTFAAGAQTPKPLQKIGVLRWDRKSLERVNQNLGKALQARGLVEGKNVTVLWRSADENDANADTIMREFIRERVDLIVAGPTPAAHAAQRATRTIPIVLYGVADPVATGLVASLARPGGNITGLSLNLFEVAAKRVEVLRDALPHLKRVAFLGSAPDPSVKFFVTNTQHAVKVLGLDLHVELIGASHEFDTAFARIAAAGAQAVIVQPIFAPYVKQTAALALKHRLPAISDWETFTRAGGLLSYGADRSPNMAVLADYVERILKGTKPSDLPVQEPTRFTLTVNLKTAKALGVTIAPIVLDRADEVIR
jgi:putative ABC transport system substrate-binding protein